MSSALSWNHGRNSNVNATKGMSGRNRKSQWLRLSIENATTISTIAAVPPAKRAMSWTVGSTEGRILVSPTSFRTPSVMPNRRIGMLKRSMKVTLRIGSGLKIGTAWRSA